MKFLFKGRTCKYRTKLSRVCIGLDWDKDGELLAIIQTGSSVVTLWDKNTRKPVPLDPSVKDPLTFISWSKVGPQVCRLKKE
jgi:hypothetical protein